MEQAQVLAVVLPIRVPAKAVVAQLDKMEIISRVTQMPILSMNRYMHQNALEMVEI